MKIDDTEFGSITIAGRTYEHDVVIRLSDKVVKRKKKLSKLRDLAHSLRGRSPVRVRERL